VRFKDTHSQLFVPLGGKVNPLRQQKLLLEDKRDRQYNIVNGDNQDFL